MALWSFGANESILQRLEVQQAIIVLFYVAPTLLPPHWGPSGVGLGR